MKIIQNPDKECVREIKKQLKDNDGYCPCQLKKNADTKCKCKMFREQLDRGETGACHCGLWIAVDEDTHICIKE